MDRTNIYHLLLINGVLHGGNRLVKCCDMLHFYHTICTLTRCKGGKKFQLSLELCECIYL